MLFIDGIFIFKMTLCSIMYELFEQKHISLQLQNNNLDSYYLQLWLEASNNNLELIDFILLIFDKFKDCKRRVYVNQLLDKPQKFSYRLSNDINNDFCRYKFIKFLKNTQYQSTHINNFINEIILLLEHINYISLTKCINNKIILFNTDLKKYENIFKHLAVQYDFENLSDQSRFLVYVLNNNFEISSK